MAKSTEPEDVDPRERHPERVEIVLPSARSIVWLVFKVYVIIVLGAGLLGMAALLLGMAIVAAIR